MKILINNLDKGYYKLPLVSPYNSPFSFSSLHLSLLTLFFFIGIFLSSCGVSDTSPTPESKEALSISSVKIDDNVINLTANPTTNPTDISLSPVVTLVFSQNITADVLKVANKITLMQGTTDVAYTITQGADAKTITIKPDNALTLATEYTLKIAKDLTVSIANKTYKLSNDAVFQFTTTAGLSPLNVTRSNTIGAIPKIPNPVGTVAETKIITLPDVRDRNNVKITPTVAVSGRSVTAVINAEGNLQIDYIVAGTDRITLTYTSVTGTKTEDINNDNIDDTITEISTTKTLTVTVTTTPQSLTISQENTIAEIPAITIPVGTVAEIKTVDLPNVRDRNNVKITPTVAVSGSNVTAVINDDGNLVVNYVKTDGYLVVNHVAVATDTITLTYTSRATTKTEDTNNDGVDDTVIETPTTKTKTLSVTIIAAPDYHTMRENTISTIPTITIPSGIIGETKTINLPDVRDKNNVKVTPTLAVNNAKATATLDASGNLQITYVQIGTAEITLTYTSTQTTKTEDTNNDGVDDTVTETSITKTKTLSVTVNAPNPLTVTRPNTIGTIPAITIPEGKVGETKTVDLSDVRDKNNVKITPIVAVSGNKVTTLINAEGNLLVNYVAVGTDTITLTYTSVEKTITEDTNNDGVNDTVTEISTTKTKAISVTVNAPDPIIVNYENAIDTIPEITIPDTFSNDERTVELPPVRDRINNIVTPTATGVQDAITTTVANGNLIISTRGTNVMARQYTIRLTYTSEYRFKKEDNNNDGVNDDVSYNPTTKTKDVVIQVIDRHINALSVTQKNKIGTIPAITNQALSGYGGQFKSMILPLVRDVNNQVVTPVKISQNAISSRNIEATIDANTLSIRYNSSATSGTYTIKLYYTTKASTKIEDTNGDNVPDNITLTPTTTIKNVVVNVIRRP